ncbi:polysaccharide biosynthesis protein [Sporolactobacillus sp. THM7-7]|nr:polysaccharide biosynthesis protein [Sporolactobacillus sp. THM7-7]
MNRYKKLAVNSIIFAVGNFGSKLISLLLVPLYTYYLSTEQFGTVDLITTTITLLLPFFTMSVYEAVLRFVMDRNYDRRSVLSNALILTGIGLLIAFFIYPIFVRIFPFHDFMLYFYLFLFTKSVNNSLMQFIRAEGKVKLFASVGIISALIVLIGSLIFLVQWNMGTAGYLLSLISADLVSCAIMILFGKVYRHFSIRSLDLNLLREMLIYSMPLIPNALMWWIMAVSDRYFITYFVGIGANGLYAMANKIPNILNMVNSIFFQAWQMSAIEEAGSKEKDTFFTNVFHIFATTMFLCTSGLLVFLKLLMEIVIAPAFYQAWAYVPFLLLAVVFASFSGFLGTNYIAAKKTMGAFRTSVIGALVNVALNFMLIPTIGTNGASLSTMISFLVIWILRMIETSRFVTIQLNLWKMSAALAVLLIQIAVLYLSLPAEFMIEASLFFVLLFMNRRECFLLTGKVGGAMKRRVFKHGV